MVEVVRKYTKFPAGSDVDIKTNGELWIAGQKKDVVISEATKSVMISAGIWGKKLTIGKRGYVTVGTNFSKVVHTIVAASRKDSDFHDLLQSGYSCQKDELEVLHLDDCVSIQYSI